jgi:hypothetical protein
MRRRKFITLLGGAIAWPIATRAQQSDPVRRIAVLMNNAKDDPEGQTRAAAFRQGVRFYLVAILFIIFDLEVSFLFPWAIALRDLGTCRRWVGPRKRTCASTGIGRRAISGAFAVI